MKEGEVYSCTCGCGLEVKVLNGGDESCCTDHKCELRCCEAPMVLKE
jgi:hypothetical protein